MVKISACYIVKNEESTLGRSLESIRSVANEIIVVDTGSTDQTANIAQQYGARIFYYQWSNDFAAARNYALKQAKGDWIIFLDADEYIREDKIANVRPLIETLHGKKEIDSVICVMENLAGVDGQLFGCNPTVRIFRNLRSISYLGKIHESIFKNGKSTRAVKVNAEGIVIRHTGYSKESIKEKLHRNNQAIEAELAQGKARGIAYLYLCDGYWGLRQYEKAIEYARKALEVKQPEKTMLDHKPYVILLESMVKLGNYSESEIDAIRARAVAHYPDHPDILLQQAYFYLAFGHLQQALDAFLQAVEANSIYQNLDLLNEFNGSLTNVQLHIAMLYDLKNDALNSLNSFYKTLEVDKYQPDAFQGLIQMIKNQPAAEIAYFLNKLYDTASEADMHFLVLHLARLKVQKVIGYYQNIWLEKFGHDECSEVVLLSQKNFEPAFQGFAADFRDTGNLGSEVLAVVALLMKAESSWTEILGPNLRPAFQRIIAAFFNDDNSSDSTGVAFQDYLALFSDLMYLSAQNQSPERLEQYLALGRKWFAPNEQVHIGNLLSGYGLYREAFSVFQNVVTSIDQSANVYFKMGYCCYRLQNFEKAAHYFSQALDNGYHRPDIFDFLGWSAQQCADEAITEKIKSLERFSKQNR